MICALSNNVGAHAFDSDICDLLTSKCKVMCMFAMSSAIACALFRRTLKHFLGLRLLNDKTFRGLVSEVSYIPEEVCCVHAKGWLGRLDRRNPKLHYLKTTYETCRYQSRLVVEETKAELSIVYAIQSDLVERSYLTQANWIRTVDNAPANLSIALIQRI